MWHRLYRLCPTRKYGLIIRPSYIKTHVKYFVLGELFICKGQEYVISKGQEYVFGGMFELGMWKADNKLSFIEAIDAFF